MRFLSFALAIAIVLVLASTSDAFGRRRRHNGCHEECCAPCVHVVYCQPICRPPVIIEKHEPVREVIREVVREVHVPCVREVYVPCVVRYCQPVCYESCCEHHRRGRRCR